MRLSYLWTAFVLNTREVLRGRIVLLLLVLIPALFYAVTALTTSLEPTAFELGSIASDRWISVPQRDESLVFIGLAATGLLTSFIGLKLMQRDADVNRRLVRCGYRAHEILAAKLAVLLCVMVAVALWVALALPLLFFVPERFATMLVGYIASGWVYGCYGMLVGAITRRELEGILFVALLTNLDSGWLQNPVWYAEAQNQTIIEVLPAHLPAQVAMAGAFTSEPISGAFAGSLGYGAGFLVLAISVFAWRMRRR
jgi:hypothetical protein